MEDLKTGGAGTEDGGADSEEKDKIEAEGTDKEPGGKGRRDDSSKSDVQRALKDLHKEKTARKEAEDKLKKLEEDKLKETGRYKDLYETTAKERDEAREGGTRAESLFKTSLRSQRVEALAEKLGIREEARDDLDHLDLSEIEVEATENGRYIVRGADKFVENLKKSKPHWFNDKKTPPFNPKGGGGVPNTGPVTADDVVKAEIKYGRNDPRFRDVYARWAKTKTTKAK